MEAGLIGGKPGALDLHPAEGPHGDMAVRIPAPGTAPMFQLDHLGGSLFHKGFDGILVGQPVGSCDGILGMFIETIVRLDHGSGPALGRYRVATHRVDFGDDADA